MLARYCVVGALAFAIDVSITMALARVVHYLVTNTVAFLLANAVQFVVAHRWVFGRAFEPGALPRLYVATLAISAAGLLLSNALVYLGVGILGQALLPSKVFAAVVVLVGNFALRRMTIYRG